MYDLHVHSTFSDGIYDVQTLIKMAKSASLLGLSITDHDTMLAYEHAEVDSSYPLLTGIEFSTNFNDHSIHLLAYSFARNSPSLKEICAAQGGQRRERAKKMLEKLRDHGVNIPFSEIESMAKGTLGRPHIAEALLRRGIVTTIHQAFDLYLGRGKACYVPLEKPLSTKEAIDAIHKENGFAVLAHPHCISEPFLIDQLLTLPFDGLECYYSSFPAHRERPFLDMALRKNLLITGGSDFHSPLEGRRRIGSSWTRKETFEVLYNRFLDNEYHRKQ